jgi:hypothetical protein
MRKLLKGTCAAALALGLLVAPASAADNPAVNQNKCDEVNGTFEGAGPGRPDNTCTVVSAEDRVDLVAASHRTQAWKAEITTPGGSDVWSFTPGGGGNPHGYERIGGGTPYLSGCFNHKGKAIDDWETNPNCQPAS